MNISNSYLESILEKIDEIDQLLKDKDLEIERQKNIISDLCDRITKQQAKIIEFEFDQFKRKSLIEILKFKERDTLIGVFQKFNHPKGAEHLTFSDYQSKYHRKINCPGCRKRGSIKMDHSDAVKCGRCKLKMQKFGNSLYTWK